MSFNVSYLIGLIILRKRGKVGYCRNDIDVRQVA